MVLPLVAAAPIIGGAIAGIGSIGAALIGNSTQKKALKLQAQESARQGIIDEKQLALTERMIEIGLATQIDAQGNITTYDEATNTWKVVPSEVQQQILNSTNDEVLRQLAVDAPLARGELLRESGRRAREGGVADGMLEDVKDNLKGVGQRKEGNIAGLLRSSRERAVNQGFDEIGANVATQALRSGSDGAGAAASLAKARAQAIAQTMGNPELEAMGITDDLNSNRTASTMNNYGAMAGRAANIGGFSPPQSIAPTLNASLATSRGANINAMNTGVQSLSNLGQENKVPGVYNPAGLVGAITDTAGSLFKSYADSRIGPKPYQYQENPQPLVSQKATERAIAALQPTKRF